MSTEEMIAIDEQREVTAFQLSESSLLDEDRLEEWLAMNS